MKRKEWNRCEMMMFKYTREGRGKEGKGNEGREWERREWLGNEKMIVS